MHDVIDGIIDGDSFYEIHKDYAENIITGFARLGGRSIGIIANQPMFLAGVLDVNSSTKAARFTRFVILSIFHYWYWWMSWILARNGPRVERNYYARSKIVVCFE